VSGLDEVLLRLGTECHLSWHQDGGGGWVALFTGIPFLDHARLVGQEIVLGGDPYSITSFEVMSDHRVGPINLGRPFKLWVKPVEAQSA
jgi:hypothetical protein